MVTKTAAPSSTRQTSCVVNQPKVLKIQKDLSTLIELEPERECSEVIGTLSEESTPLGKIDHEINLLSTSIGDHDPNEDSSANANSMCRSNDGGYTGQKIGSCPTLPRLNI